MFTGSGIVLFSFLAQRDVNAKLWGLQERSEGLKYRGGSQELCFQHMQQVTVG